MRGFLIYRRLSHPVPNGGKNNYSEPCALILAESFTDAAAKLGGELEELPKNNIGLVRAPHDVEPARFMIGEIQILRTKKQCRKAEKLQ